MIPEFDEFPIHQTVSVVVEGAFGRHAPAGLRGILDGAP